ncbi:MAG: flagellar brake protein [Nitrosomonadales bacterium]|nr:flagellar brake protein [Nitrosomonadales bacterium]
MSLVSVNSKDIVVGQPLPWPLYDQQYNLLLFQGDAVRDNEHRAELLAKGAFHELSLETADHNNAPLSTPGNPVQSQENEGDTGFTFDDMQLKVEDKLQLEPPAQLTRERILVKVIGFLRGRSLLVTAPVAANGVRLQLVEGENVVMRSFTGQKIFAFACSVEKVCKLPYEYLHLSFPTQIEGVVIRKAPRVKVHIITTVKESHPGPTESISAYLTDISASGASLDSKQQLGKKGEILNLEFKVNVHDMDVYLSVKGVIRAVLSGDTVDGLKAGITRHGIEFQKLQPNDQIILKSLIYQQLIENPHLRV